MKVAQLIDAARAASGIESDYRVSKVLGVTTQLVSQWRAGSKYPGALAVYRLAELAHRPPQQVMAELELERAERAGRDADASAWRQMVEKVGGVAAAMAAVVILSAAPNPAEASNGAGSGPSASGDALYIGARRRRRGSRAAQVLARLAESLAGAKFCAA